MRRYTISWTLEETHETTLTEDELAELLGTTVDRLNPDDPDGDTDEVLENALAQVEDNDTYDGCTYRSNVEVTVFDDTSPQADQAQNTS